MEAKAKALIRCKYANMQMAKMQTKRRSTSLIIKEMQIKTTRRGAWVAQSVKRLSVQLQLRS